MGSHALGRSIAAISVGALLVVIIDRTLEQNLVVALAGAPPTDVAGYLAVRNRPAVLVMTLVTHGFACALAGYILGRIARVDEVRHAAVSVVLLVALYIYVFVQTNEMLPPVWVRALMLVMTPPALLGGAKVRADARAIREESAPVKETS